MFGIWLVSNWEWSLFLNISQLPETVYKACVDLYMRLEYMQV